jgi:hypothetical protein
MAQIIKHRRGSIASLKGTTARNGELIIASGSISDLSGPFVFVGSPNSVDEGVAGAFKAVSKIYQGGTAPTITAGTYGSTLDGTPFYASGNKSLYVLNNDGAGGNTRLDLTGNIEGNTISGLTINRLNGALGLNGDLLITGNTYQTGSITLTGDVTLRGNINIGDNLTGDTVTLNSEISSSLIPDSNNNFDLGSTSKYWKNLYVSGTAFISQLSLGSIQLTNLDLPGNLTVSGATTLYSATTINAALTVTGNTTVNGDFLANGSNSTLSANYGGNNIELNAYNGATIDLNGQTNINGNTNVTGALNVGGNVTITGLTNNRVVIVGSNGVLEDDTNFTFDGTKLNVGGGDFEVDVLSGDTRLSGSLLVKNSATVTGSLNVTNIKGTGSLYLQGDQNDSRYFEIYNTAVSDTHIKSNGGMSFFGDDTNYLKIDDSLQTATIVGVNGVFVSSSLTVTGTTTIHGNETVNGILTVTGNTQLGGNLYVSGTLEVLGSSTEVHIQSQVIELDDNIIRLNAYSPFQRYAGFEVNDSGSSGVSASMVWDSLNDYWMFVSGSGQSSKLIGTSYGTYGSENSLTTNAITKTTSANTVGNSLLTDDATTLAYNTNKFTVASGDGATLIAGNVTVSSAGGADAGTNSSAIVFRNSSNVLGYISTTETTDVLDGILGYKNSDGALVFSTVIDGGAY